MKFRDLVPFRKNKDLSIRREEAHQVASAQRQLDRLFDDFWRGWDQWPFHDLQSFGNYDPRVDVAETPEYVEVTAEMPGMSKKDVDVTLSARGNALTLRGDKKDEREGRRKGQQWSERRFGSFCRTVALPADVKEKNADATLENGVLRIRLRKKTPAEGGRRRIEVTAS